MIRRRTRQDAVCGGVQNCLAGSHIFRLGELLFMHPPYTGTAAMASSSRDIHAAQCTRISGWRVCRGCARLYRTCRHSPRLRSNSVWSACFSVRRFAVHATPRRRLRVAIASDATRADATLRESRHRCATISRVEWIFRVPSLRVCVAPRELMTNLRLRAGASSACNA